MKNSNPVLVPLNFKTINDFQIQNEFVGGPTCDCFIMNATTSNNSEAVDTFLIGKLLNPDLKPECANGTIFPIY